MNVTFFSAKPYDKTFFSELNKQYQFDLTFFETHLGPHIVNAVKENTFCVCVFVNDKLTDEVITILGAKGVKLIALRCAGFNNVDLESAKRNGIHVCRVPAYSPEAVAEHAVAMILALNRKIHKAYNRVREQNFALDGLLGFNLHGKKIGVIGTGKIGKAFIKIMLGFGCTVFAYDKFPDSNFHAPGFSYVSFEQLLRESDVISLHCPLTSENHYMINDAALSMMKPGIMIINTSRGGLINTDDMIKGLKSGKVGYFGLDVYEQEEKLFFRDLSASIIEDDRIQRLMSFPNVLVTGHQAFFTNEALTEIASTTLNSIALVHAGKINQVAAGIILT
ncbi:MAG: 2-hydroxyacid dehydrogenase [Cyclobacteriaceae bacterium]|nr:2-hydroxyacid dehydrogenase [Cyclobacteriaceae bacterium]